MIYGEPDKVQIEFIVKVIGKPWERPNNVVTQVWKIHPARYIHRGYHGSEYVRKGGLINESRELLGELKGTLTYKEEREWSSVYGAQGD